MNNNFQIYDFIDGYKVTSNYITIEENVVIPECKLTEITNLLKDEIIKHINNLEKTFKEQ